MEQSKPKLKYGTGCTICADIEVKGDVTVGNGTIIHPKARIIAEAGPIIIGDNNVIEEKAIIWNKSSMETSGSTPVMIIGNFNVFEVEAHCQSLKVGDSNVFEPKSFVGREVVVTVSCVIGASCSLIDAEILPEQVSIFGKNNQRLLTQVHQNPLLQMETLAKLLSMHQDVMKKTSNN